MPRRNTREQNIVVEAANINEAGLEDNKTFEETVVKVEVYESERAITRALDDYQENGQEEKQLVRKIDVRLLPILGSIFFFQSLDRNGTHGPTLTAKARQLYRDDLGYSTIIWIFFGLYLGVVINSNLILSRTKPSKYLPTLVIIGGIINTLISVFGSIKSIIIFRFPISVIEAVYFPGVLYLLSCWYKPQELGKRIALFPTIAIAAQLVGNFITLEALERQEILSSIGVLRYIFFVDGLLSILAALVAFVILPDYPAITRGFTRRERELATIRLLKRGQDTGSSASRGIERLTAVEAIFAAIRDPRVIIVSIIAVLSSAAGTASHMLLTSTIQTGYSSLRAHRFGIAAYLVSIVLINVVSWTSDRTRDRRWHILAVLGLATVGAISVSAVSIHSPVKIVFVSLFTSSIWATIPLTFAWAAVSVRAPAEKRAVVLAIVHGVSGAACVFGLQLWPRMCGARSRVSAILAITFLLIAVAVAFIIPQFVNLESYKGTRAERDQALRRCDHEQVEEILVEN